jgi:biopolymer transport protein ExbD
MAITFNKSRNDDDALMAEINTTPLVDVMLVLLIIFLITIPAVTSSIQVKLPVATNVKSEAEAQTIIISVDADSVNYWQNEKLTSSQDLEKKLAAIKVMDIKPAVHIRGDVNVRFDAIRPLLQAFREAGVVNIGFITQPAAKN